MQQINKTGFIIKFGEVGAPINQIKFHRTEMDGEWTLSNDYALVAVVKRSDAR